MRVPARIPTTAQQRSQEAGWIQSCHPQWGLVLMELAGRQAAELALALFEQNPGPIVVFCGRGNNGGDGFVVARYLRLHGIPVTVYMVQSTSELREESSTNKAVLEKLGVPVLYVDPTNLVPVREALASAGVVVDALLGTGLDRPVDGIYLALIDAINDSGRPVLSIDLPSGVNSDTGEVMGRAIQAVATVTFGYLKAGLLCYPGAALSGLLNLVEIGLPPLEPEFVAVESHTQQWLSTASLVRSGLPIRPADSHKGTFGNVLTIAGSLGMMGAAVLASKTALRAGAGRSVLATPASLVAHLPPQELVCRALPETSSGTIGHDAMAAIEAELKNADAVVLGPGISQNEDTVRLVQELVKQIDKPCIIDADGLNAIANNPACWPCDAGHFVVTPHPKERSRLLGSSTAENQSNRIAAAQKAAAKFGCVVVLKGARTIVASKDQEVFINPTGNAGMATAGTGDVLSGLIGGLLAQGVEPLSAAVAGTYIHGAAGDLAAEELGEDGTIAGDLITFVPPVLSKLRAGEFRSRLESQLFGPGR